MNSHYQHFLNATATKGTYTTKDYETSSVKDSPTTTKDYGTSSVKDSPTYTSGTLTTTITKDDISTLPIKDGTTINIFNPEGTTTTKSSGEEIDVGVGGGAGAGSGGGGGFGGGGLGGGKKKKKTVKNSKIPWLLLAIAVTAGGYYYFNK